MRKSATLRFLGMVAALVVVFGGCGSLTLGAFDKEQTQSTAPLFNLVNLFHYVTHFLQDLLGVIFIYHDHAGIPFHNYFLFGVATTITFCFLAMPMALLIGLALALMSRSRLRIVRTPARTFVEFFRNTPLLVQLLAIYTSLLFLPPSFLNAFTAGIATLVLNYAAYECENLRAGIEAVDRGQREAAQTLGLSAWQSLRLIVIPQMIPIVLPPVINDLIYMYKDSAILSLITILELTVQGTNLSRRFAYLSWQFYVVTGLIYLLLSLPLGRLARVVENRLRSPVKVAPRPGMFMSRPMSTLGLGLRPLRPAVGQLAAPSSPARRDRTVIALSVLGAMAAVGWLCYVLTLGFSPGNIALALQQILYAAALSILLILFIFCTLGLIVYIVGTPFALRGRLQRAPRYQPEETGVLATLSK